MESSILIAIHCFINCSSKFKVFKALGCHLKFIEIFLSLSMPFCQPFSRLSLMRYKYSEPSYFVIFLSVVTITFISLISFRPILLIPHHHFHKIMCFNFIFVRCKLFLDVVMDHLTTCWHSVIVIFCLRYSSTLLNKRSLLIYNCCAFELALLYSF